MPDASNATVVTVDIVSPDQADREKLEADLAAIWARMLKCDRVGLDDNYFLLGGDSLSAVELFLEIERVLGIAIPRSALFNACTVREMTDFIMEEDEFQCLVKIKPEGTLPPLYFFHDGTGQVLNYGPVSSRMPADRPVYAFQSLGLDTKSTPHTTVEEMTARYVREMKRAQPGGPYHLAGFSMGGRIALDVARRLTEQGDQVAFLGLIDTYSTWGRRHASIPRWLRNEFALGKKKSPIRWHRHIIERFAYFRRLISERRAWRKGHAALATGENRPWLHHDNIYLINKQASRTYRPAPYSGRVAYFSGDLLTWQHEDMHRLWGDVFTGRFDVYTVEGIHTEIMREANADALAVTFTKALSEHTGWIQPTTMV